MSTGFQAVQWNRAKIIYDLVVVAGAATFIAAYSGIAFALASPEKPALWEDVRIHAFGACAYLMMTIILCIGPLARLNPKFLPLLYNRRHFGVIAFVIALSHAFFVFEWFAARGALPSLWTEITNPAHYTQFAGISNKPLGLAALFIFFVMAATSHDYWLKVLSPPFWKAMHMAIYIAYALIVMHVAMGVMQSNHSPLVPMLLLVTAGSVVALHVAAALKERILDKGIASDHEGWISVGTPESILDKRARIVAAPGGERIAVFRDGRMIGAVSNLCAHQNGPVGEGEIIDGCITCPWHGWQYKLDDGRSPPPFKEELATYRVRLRAGIVEVHRDALPPGTPAAMTLPA
jgi:nitrite reductase/ring-hydroxylating ferredoxin subunit